MNIRIKGLVLMISPLTPLDWKRRAVKYYPQKVAVIDGEKEFTYREFGRRVDQLSSALNQAGIDQGDHVAVMHISSVTAMRKC